MNKIYGHMTVFLEKSVCYVAGSCGVNCGLGFFVCFVHKCVYELKVSVIKHSGNWRSQSWDYLCRFMGT